MRPLGEVLSGLIGRTIVELGTEDDELMLGLDDGQVVWVYIEDDGLMMTVSHEDIIPTQ